MSPAKRPRLNGQRFEGPPGLRPCLVVALALSWTWPALGQTGEETSEAESVPDAGDASEDRAEKAHVHVIVFVGDAPVAGAEIGLSGARGESASSDGDGSARLANPESGNFPLWVRVPREAVPDAPAGGGRLEIPLRDIQLVRGETVEVIVTLAPDGRVVSVDTESVAGSVQEAREIESEHAEVALASGFVKGAVRDSEKNQVVAGARVFVRGSSVEATTDAEGRFSLELPEGSWTVSVIHPDFTTASQPDIAVVADEERDVEFRLLPASTELEDFVITVPHVEGSVASVLSERRESAALSDAISAEDISKSGAGDAAGAAQRVVGVTIIDGKFVYVRGLGERYTNSLLNGSPMPSPEPDKATVPLDLLPTQVIRSIDIAKTSTPDFPADFAGGSVRIETITVPEEPIFGLSLKTGYNTQSTFRKRAAFATSPTDFLGFDSGRRRLPDSVPSEYTLNRGERKPDGERLTREEVAEVARDMNTPMVPRDRRNLPNLGGSVIYGRGWDLSDDVRVGALTSMTYSRKPSLRQETIRTFLLAGSDDELRRWVDGRATSAVDTVRWGAFGSVAAKLFEHHEISLIGLRSQIADDKTRLFEFYSANNDGDYYSVSNQYTSRSLQFAQLRGLHDFPVLFGAEFDWRVSLARANLNRPDMRDVVYYKAATSDVWAYSSGTESGRHFFADMVEHARSVYADYTQPIVEGDLEKKLKFGGGANSKKRIFKARRFSFAWDGDDQERVCGPEFNFSCPEDIFTDENIESGNLVLQEDTGNTDAYQARSDVYAGYAMADFKLFKPLRVIGGARVERTEQAVSAYNQFDPQDDEDIVEVNFESTDVLPSISIVYALTDWLELRAAGSRTVARPQLREVGPFQFADYFGGVLVNGNPDLEITKIYNADLRADLFPSPSEVISLSVFAKDFTDPIEPVLKPSSSSILQTYENANGAFLYGLELEARKSLEFISASLEHFGIMGNLTLARSQIDIEQTGTDASGEVGFITTTERPMVNQSPYVVNLALDFEVPDQTHMRLLYNVSGKQIVAIGTSGLPDSYLQPRHLLDFTFSQHLTERIEFGASVENILNSLYLVTQGKERDKDRITYGYRTGLSVGVSLGYSL